VPSTQPASRPVGAINTEESWRNKRVKEGLSAFWRGSCLVHCEAEGLLQVRMMACVLYPKD
jgi:hypothetical protein